jgi:hypothetical protein
VSISGVSPFWGAGEGQGFFSDQHFPQKTLQLTNPSMCGILHFLGQGRGKDLCLGATEARRGNTGNRGKEGQQGQEGATGARRGNRGKKGQQEQGGATGQQGQEGRRPC